MGMPIRDQREHRTWRNRQASSTRGFSLLELMIVVAISLIIAGFAVISTQTLMKDARVTGAFDNAFMQLRMARERAIAERKRYIVTFGTPAPPLALTPLGAPTAKSIQLYKWDQGLAPTQVSTIDLPSDVGFQALAGLPTAAAQVPDGFGAGTVAIDFDQGVGPGGGNLVVFMPDGSAHDLAGNSNNGILYVARNTDLSSSRALTVFGISGRVRGWRLTLPGGAPLWKQQ
jgi:prepilin-type N-terminal cleavage/methylation domain-containing protein